MAMLSKDITLYRNGEPLKNLLDIPELGNSSEAIEVTTLADGARRYIDGIDNYGDAIPFNFIYEAEQFDSLQTSTEEDEWKVELPDKKFCTFTGKGSVKMGAAGVNAALQYVLNIRPNSKINWNPTEA